MKNSTVWNTLLDLCQIRKGAVPRRLVNSKLNHSNEKYGNGASQQSKRKTKCKVKRKAQGFKRTTYATE